jgi:5'(3')-deoxyribonucleotidase
VNKRKTIAIDIDDTIAGSTEALRLRVNEKKELISHKLAIKYLENIGAIMRESGPYMVLKQT